MKLGVNENEYNRQDIMNRKKREKIEKKVPLGINSSHGIRLL